MMLEAPYCDGDENHRKLNKQAACKALARDQSLKEIANPDLQRLSLPKLSIKVCGLIKGG